MPKEIEIKFRVTGVRALTRKLRAAGFRLRTPRTHEMNTLYDLPGGILRNRKELLRIRKYGSIWTITHKSGKKIGRHSSRIELETEVTDGKTLDAIVRALGYSPSFRYEKFRAEWIDGKATKKAGKGVIVVDETPIGNFCETEGPPALDRRHGKEIRGEAGRLHHKELCHAVCGMERRNEKLGKGNDVHSDQRLIPIVIPSEARDLGSCLRLHIPRSLSALGMTNPCNLTIRGTSYISSLTHTGKDRSYPPCPDLARPAAPALLRRRRPCGPTPVRASCGA